MTFKWFEKIFSNSENSYESIERAMKESKVEAAEIAVFKETEAKGLKQD